MLENQGRSPDQAPHTWHWGREVLPTPPGHPPPWCPGQEAPTSAPRQLVSSRTLPSISRLLISSSPALACNENSNQPRCSLRGAISPFLSSAEISQAVGFSTRVPRSFIHQRSPTGGKEITPAPEIIHTWDPRTGHNISGVLDFGVFLHNIKTEINPLRELKAKPCSCPWVRAGQIIAIKKKKRDMWTFISTDLRMQPAGGGQFTVARTLRNQSTAQKYLLSSEVPAVPSGATSASTRLGQPVPAAATPGGSSAAGRHKAALYPKVFCAGD